MLNVGVLVGHWEHMYIKREGRVAGRVLSGFYTRVSDSSLPSPLDHRTLPRARVTRLIWLIGPPDSPGSNFSRYLPVFVHNILPYCVPD